MRVEPELEDTIREELRNLFRQGCSVSELLRHVRRRLPAEATAGRRLGRFLDEAFGIGPGALYVLAYTESFGNGQVPDARLNAIFVPRIVECRGEWDQADGSEPGWDAGCPKTGSADLHRTAEGYRCGLSEGGWAGLDESDRAALRTAEATRLALGEDVEILAALVERIQGRLGATTVDPAAPAEPATVA